MCTYTWNILQKMPLCDTLSLSVLISSYVYCWLIRKPVILLVSSIVYFRAVRRWNFPSDTCDKLYFKCKDFTLQIAQFYLQCYYCITNTGVICYISQIGIYYNSLYRYSYHWITQYLWNFLFHKSSSLPSWLFN